MKTSRLTLPDPVGTAYLAGLFDGEGCLTRYASNNNWVAQIGMTNKPVTDWLATLGGSLRVEDGPGRGGRQPLYRWRVLAQVEVQHLIEALLPHLIVKREVAIRALQDLSSRPE